MVRHRHDRAVPPTERARKHPSLSRGSDGTLKQETPDAIDRREVQQATRAVVSAASTSSARCGPAAPVSKSRHIEASTRDRAGSPDDTATERRASRAATSGRRRLFGALRQPRWNHNAFTGCSTGSGGIGAVSAASRSSRHDGAGCSCYPLRLDGTTTQNKTRFQVEISTSLRSSSPTHQAARRGRAALGVISVSSERTLAMAMAGGKRSAVRPNASRTPPRRLLGASITSGCHPAAQKGRRHLPVSQPLQEARESGPRLITSPEGSAGVLPHKEQLPDGIPSARQLYHRKPSTEPVIKPTNSLKYGAVKKPCDDQGSGFQDVGLMPAQTKAPAELEARPIEIQERPRMASPWPGERFPERHPITPSRRGLVLLIISCLTLSSKWSTTQVPPKATSNRRRPRRPFIVSLTTTTSSLNKEELTCRAPRRLRSS